MIESTSNAEQTRAALVLAALRLFGKQGFEGTSTREIAAAARANIGSIAYHFGGKEGLRSAVADHIVEVIQAIAARTHDSAPSHDVSHGPQAGEAAERAMISMIENMFGFFVTQPEAGEIVPFVLREMSVPSPAFERVYSGVIEPLHRRSCALWQAATGEPAESETTRIKVFLMIGQIVYFRLAREAVLRRMGWDTMGPLEGNRIAAIAIENFKVLLAARKDEAQ